jgi:predicted CoA-substrate-specific enzyme activase
LRTRIEAFAEGFTARQTKGTAMSLSAHALVAGIDSGSTSTDVVIMDTDRTIVASTILPTQGSATASAERSLQAALDQAGIARTAIERVVSTGYGRDAIGGSDDSVTEITCHAKGAHYLNPQVRTIVDIGGQDSKAISIDANGAVRNFAMNDKCAAGTGRFLEMMARTLGVTLEDMSALGLQSKHDVTISSTCTVFAESEVVSLVARDTALPDIVAALDRSVASKTASLAKRVGVEDTVMMTGGVAKNIGVVRAIEAKLGRALVVDDRAQICGAIGAALFALE